MFKLPRAFKNHLYSWNDICLDEEARLCTNLMMICFTLLITSVLLIASSYFFGTFMGGLAWIEWLALFSGITLCVQWVSKKHSYLFTCLQGSFLLFLCVYLLYTGNMSNLSPICILLFPFAGSLATTPKHSLIVSGVLLVTVCVMLLTPVHALLRVPYSMDFRLQYPIMMFFCLTMINYTEISRHKMKERMEYMAKELQLMAYRDQLTRSYNRHALISHFGSLQHDAAGYSFALLDLDDFKDINDTYGHFVGDDVLRHVSDVIQLQLPTNGYLYRWGGEEFLIVVWDIPQTDFVALLEKIRCMIHSMPLVQDGVPIHITSSFGAMCGMSGMSIQSCLMQADKQLYYAKNNGKNQVAFLMAS